MNNLLGAIFEMVVTENGLIPPPPLKGTYVRLKSNTYLSEMDYFYRCKVSVYASKNACLYPIEKV
jgi:hypothetical protein